MSENAIVIVLACMALVGLVVLCGLALSRLYQKRKEWAQLAAFFTADGLTDEATLLSELSQGNVAGALNECLYLLRQYSDPTKAAARVAKVMAAMLPAALNDPARMPAVAKLVAAWIAANPSAAAAAGLATVTPTTSK